MKEQIKTILLILITFNLFMATCVGWGIILGSLGK